MRRTPSQHAPAGALEDDLELARLEAALDLRGADIRKALQEQPDLYYRGALAAARLASQVDAAECEVTSAEARVENALREANRDRHEPLSDEHIARRVAQNIEFARARRHAGELRRKLLLARALEEALVQRMRALEALGA